MKKYQLTEDIAQNRKYCPALHKEMDKKGEDDVTQCHVTYFEDESCHVTYFDDESSLLRSGKIGASFRG